jgi:hypothetical protein
MVMKKLPISISARRIGILAEKEALASRLVFWEKRMR